MDESLKKLVQDAKMASIKAYAPYSKFKVGCIVKSDHGNIYSACNVENVSFGLTICAERAAVFRGISSEGPSFKINQVVIYTPTKKPITPCGACRQVLKEFGSDFEIISACDSDEEIKMHINDLLPSPPDIQI